jgi:hypothetical protein
VRYKHNVKGIRSHCIIQVGYKYNVIGIRYHVLRVTLKLSRGINFFVMAVEKIQSSEVIVGLNCLRMKIICIPGTLLAH